MEWGCTLEWWESSEAVSILQTLFVESRKLSVSRESAGEDLSEVSSNIHKDLKFIHSGMLIAITLHGLIALNALLFSRTAEIYQWIFEKLVIKAGDDDIGLASKGVKWPQWDWEKSIQQYQGFVK